MPVSVYEISRQVRKQLRFIPYIMFILQTYLHSFTYILLLAFRMPSPPYYVVGVFSLSVASIVLEKMPVAVFIPVDSV